MTSEELDNAIVAFVSAYPWDTIPAERVYAFLVVHGCTVNAGYARLQKLLKAKRLVAYRYKDSKGRMVTEAFGIPGVGPATFGRGYTL